MRKIISSLLLFVFVSSFAFGNDDDDEKKNLRRQVALLMKQNAMLKSAAKSGGGSSFSTKKSRKKNKGALVNKFDSERWGEIVYIGSAILFSIGQKKDSSNPNVVTLAKVFGKAGGAAVFELLPSILQFLQDHVISEDDGEEALMFNLAVGQITQAIQTVLTYKVKKGNLSFFKHMKRALELNKRYVDLEKLESIFIRAKSLAKGVRKSVLKKKGVRFTVNPKPLSVKDESEYEDSDDEEEGELEDESDDEESENGGKKLVYGRKAKKCFEDYALDYIKEPMKKKIFNHWQYIDDEYETFSGYIENLSGILCNMKMSQQKDYFNDVYNKQQLNYSDYEEEGEYESEGEGEYWSEGEDDTKSTEKRLNPVDDFLGLLGLKRKRKNK